MIKIFRILDDISSHLPAGLELLSSFSHCSFLLLGIGGCSISAASGSASFSSRPIHSPITRGLRREELNATVSWGEKKNFCALDYIFPLIGQQGNNLVQILNCSLKSKCSFFSFWIDLKFQFSPSLLDGLLSMICADSWRLPWERIQKWNLWFGQLHVCSQDGGAGLAFVPEGGACAKAHTAEELGAARKWYISSQIWRKLRWSQGTKSRRDRAGRMHCLQLQSTLDF